MAEAGKWSTWKIVIGAIVVVIIVIQFIPVNKTNPPVQSEVPAPEYVKPILERACYNCHSNETNWPWYSAVAPVSWLVAHDVNEAREHLNLSTWDEYRSEVQKDKVAAMWEMVDIGEMPLWYYQIMHPESELSEEDKNAFRKWTDQVYAESGDEESTESEVDHSEHDH